MPTWNDSLVQQQLKRLRLSVDPRRRRIGVGSRLGAGAGSSLEFHDHRAYVAGDDLRHLDWSVYARTDQLMLRRHRQEVSPRVEIILDLSLSMGFTDTKLTLATTLAALLATLAEADGARPVLWLSTNHHERVIGTWRQTLQAARVEGAAGIASLPAPSLTPGSERIVISDLLCADNARTIVQRLGEGAGTLAAINVLTQSEREPATVGPVRLEDVEGGANDLVLDEQAVAAYRQRLARHIGAWEAALSGRGVGVISLIADDGTDAALTTLLRYGLLEPRSG